MSATVFAGRTDLGRRRKRNEDSIHIDPDKGFCLVADGIGGTAAGHIASQEFAATARSRFAVMPETENEKYERIQAIFLHANDAILDYAAAHPGCEGMGCTAELLVLAPGRFILGHIGDSRTYRFRAGELRQLTRDHSLVQEQLDQGLITPEEAVHHSFKNVILRAVGIKKNPALDILRGNLFSKDIFLLCSDGLTDMVSDDVIKKILTGGSTLEDKADTLIQQANTNGGKDNISVVLAQIL